MSSAICFNLDQSEILSSDNGLTIYHTVPSSNDPGKRSHFSLKALWEKKEMLVTSIFAFSPFTLNVFYFSQNKVHFLIHNYDVICKVFQIWSKILPFGKVLYDLRKKV